MAQQRVVGIAAATLASAALLRLIAAGLGAIPISAAAASPPSSPTALCDGRWVSALGGFRGASKVPLAMVQFDDGQERRLCVGGGFSWIAGLGAEEVASWNGEAWQGFGPLPGSPLGGTVTEFTVHDDGSGSGPSLYAARSPILSGGNVIVRWDGKAWASVSFGLTGSVVALVSYDDGSGNGPALYAGGSFTIPGHAGSRNIARLDGTAWQPLLGGTDGFVYDFATWDWGAGPHLIVAGNFTNAGGVPCNGIASWDGRGWSPLGTGLVAASPRGERFAAALATYDDGNGESLWVGGAFGVAGGIAASNIARWDGRSWHAVGEGFNGSVQALAVFAPDSDGPAYLYAGGSFSMSGDTPMAALARWTGGTWTDVDGGVTASAGMGPASVAALCAFDDETGPRLVASGQFDKAGGVYALRLAHWSVVDQVGTWSAVAEGPVGTVQRLYVQGGVEQADGSLRERLFMSSAQAATINPSAATLEMWDGTAWTTLAANANGEILDILVDDASTPEPHDDAIFIAGTFTQVDGVAAPHIARWMAGVWSGVGGGMDGPVRALALGAGQSGTVLYAGGNFSAAGGIPAARIARWNGQVWSAMGALQGGPVRAIALYDDGSGAGVRVYVGGGFTAAGGISRIAVWNGSEWSKLGSGVNNAINAFTVTDLNDGHGPSLYVGGDFTLAGDMPATRVARWNAEGWSAVGEGFDASVRTLAAAVEQDSGKRWLYAGGDFDLADGSPAHAVARWDGAAWDALGPVSPPSAPGVAEGVSGAVGTLAFVQDPRLGLQGILVGGSFLASPAADSLLARWSWCWLSCPGDFDVDGAVGAEDLRIVIDGWGTTAGDADGNGTTDAADLAQVLGTWGECPLPR